MSVTTFLNRNKRNVIATITLDSNEHRYNNNHAHLRISLNPPINLSNSTKNFIRLNYLRIPNTVYNISEELKNNTYTMFVTKDSIQYTHSLVIPDGIYDNELMSGLFRSHLIETKYDEYGGLVPTFVYDTAPVNAKSRFILTTAETLIEEIKFDFNPNLQTFLGLEGETVIITPESPVYIGNGQVNYYPLGSDIFIRSNLIDNYFGSKLSDILGIDTWKSNGWTSQTYDVVNVYHPLKSEFNNQVRVIEILFCDSTFNLLKFQGTTLDSNVVCQISITD